MQKSKKLIPVFEQNDALIFENIYDDGYHFWFTGFNYNALFKMDKEKWTVKLIGIFPDENFMQERLYISMVKCNEKIYFAPYSAKEIATYDLNTNTFKKIPVFIPRKNSHSSWKYEKFFRVTAIKEKIYFIPYYYPGILCYDTKADKWCCFDDWIDKVEEHRVSEWGYFIEFIIDENKLILPCTCANAIVIFDVITQTSQIILTPETSYSCKYCGICHVGEYFYLVSADGTVLKEKLDSAQEDIKRIQLPVSDCNEIEYYPVRYMEGYIYLFPFGKNSGFKIDIKTDQVVNEEFFNGEKKIKGHNFSFLLGIVDCKKMYTLTGNSRYFIEYDFNNRSIHKSKLFLSKLDQNLIEENKKKEFIKKIHSKAVIEDSIAPLSLMLSVLNIYNSFERRNDNTKKGTKIYFTLKKFIHKC